MISAGKIVASGAAFVLLFGAGLAPEAPLGLGATGNPIFCAILKAVA